MNHLFQSLLLVFILVACKANKQPSDLTYHPYCEKGQMRRAWYTLGQDEPLPKIGGLENKFLIYVDKQIMATNFISDIERWSRKHAIELDTAELIWTENWEKLSVKEKFELLEYEKEYYRIRADDLHQKNNFGKHQVWIMNNTEDTVSLQMQDWSYICILQAQDKNKQWQPIEYWRLAFCGNSYYTKSFPPYTANSFVTELPENGNFSTKLRYKLLGKEQYYYSNEFEGTINYCQFFEDTTTYHDRRMIFKMDSVFKFVW